MTIGYACDAISQVVDVVVANKYGVNSPIPLTVIILAYLLIIHKIAPSFMESRPAFQLKTYMVVYNVFQVTSCIYLVYRICVVNAPTLQFWECGAFQRGSPVEMDYNHICVLTFWLKVTELSETVVFVLRKKERQISFLHVFHHCATLLLAYLLYTNYRGSAGLYPLFLNCNVHIVMYLYYLMSAVLPANIVAQLTPLKKAITTVQMVQFALILLQVALALIRGCEVSHVIVAVYVLIISTFFYMFYDFYKTNYNARRQPAGESKKNLTKN